MTGIKETDTKDMKTEKNCRCDGNRVHGFNLLNNICLDEEYWTDCCCQGKTTPKSSIQTQPQVQGAP